MKVQVVVEMEYNPVPGSEAYPDCKTQIECFEFDTAQDAWSDLDIMADNTVARAQLVADDGIVMKTIDMEYED